MEWLERMGIRGHTETISSVATQEGWQGTGSALPFCAAAKEEPPLLSANSVNRNVHNFEQRICPSNK